MAVKVTVLFFAGLREALGCGTDGLQRLGRHLGKRGALHEVEHRQPARKARVAVDQAMAAAETRLHEGAEVAFFPPVTGG